MRNITVLTTGGTIDKCYGSGTGIRDLHIGTPVVGKIIGEKLAFPGILRIKSLMSKDSLDITDEDRKMIAEECAEARTQSIIITHGTDTMVNTAEVIANSGISHNKLIVLTGSLKPACVVGSDAEFNLGMAFAHAQLENLFGIFIAMNGIHRWNTCEKHNVTGRFYRIN